MQEGRVQREIQLELLAEMLNRKLGGMLVLQRGSKNWAS